MKNAILCLLKVSSKSLLILLILATVGCRQRLAENHYKQAVVLSQLGQYEEAVAEFDSAIEFAPEYVDAWQGKADAYLSLEKYEQAYQAYDQTARLDPKRTDAGFGMALCLENMDNYEEAIAVYDKVLERRPKDPNSWFGKGNCFKGLRKYDDALKAYNKVIEFSPEAAGAWYNQAWIYAQKKEKTNVLADLAKAISLDGDYKEQAKADEAFQWLREDAEFKKLTD